MIEVNRQIIINAPLETVWNTSAHQFDQIGRWSSGVSESSAIEEQSLIDDLDIAGRVCVTSLGNTKEKFIKYDAKAHQFTYEIKGGPMPSFVKQALNTWTIRAISPQQTELMMSASMDLPIIFRILLQIPMRFQLGKTLQDNLEELKHYIETGEPHPRKIKAMKSVA